MFLFFLLGMMGKWSMLLPSVEIQRATTFPRQTVRSHGGEFTDDTSNYITEFQRHRPGIFNDAARRVRTRARASRGSAVCGRIEECRCSRASSSAGRRTIREPLCSALVVLPRIDSAHGPPARNLAHFTSTVAVWEKLLPRRARSTTSAVWAILSSSRQITGCYSGPWKNKRAGEPRGGAHSYTIVTVSTSTSRSLSVSLSLSRLQLFALFGRCRTFSVTIPPQAKYVRASVQDYTPQRFEKV